MHVADLSAVQPELHPVFAILAREGIEVREDLHARPSANFLHHAQCEQFALCSVHHDASSRADGDPPHVLLGGEDGRVGRRAMPGTAPTEKAYSIPPTIEIEDMTRTAYVSALLLACAAPISGVH